MQKIEGCHWPSDYGLQNSAVDVKAVLSQFLSCCSKMIKKAVFGGKSINDTSQFSGPGFIYCSILWRHLSSFSKKNYELSLTLYKWGHIYCLFLASVCGQEQIWDIWSASQWRGNRHQYWQLEHSWWNKPDSRHDTFKCWAWVFSEVDIFQVCILYR